MTSAPEPAASAGAIRLTVVAPVRNEVENLAEFLDELEGVLGKAPETAGRYEVLFVDDGSDDGSRELLLKLRAGRPAVRVLFLDGKHGKTSALDAGFKAARGEVFVTIDADLQDDPADIPKMLACLNDADAVNGRRAVRRDSALRRMSSRVANWVRNRLTGETITDSAGGLKMYKRECLAGIKLFHGLHRFMPTLVRMEGFRVVEVPVNNRPRLRGTAKYGFWNRVFAAFWDLLAVRWMKNRRLRHKVEEN